MKRCPVLLLIILELNLCNAANNNLPAVIELIREYETQIQQVTGFLCWDNAALKKLTMSLNMQGLSFHSHKSKMNNIQNANHNLVIFDSNCIYPDNNSIKNLASSQHILIINANTCDNFSTSAINHLQKFYIFPAIANSASDTFKCIKQFPNSRWISAPYYFSSINKLRNAHIIYKQPAHLDVTVISAFGSTQSFNDSYRNLILENTSKFNYHLFLELFAFLNIKPIIRFQSTVSKSHSSELIVFPSKVFRENQTNFDFLSLRTPDKQSFLMRAPPLSTVSNIFTLPLQLNVWYASYILLAIFFVIIAIFVKVEWRYPDMITDKYRVLYPNVLDVIHMHIGAISQQGSEAEPISVGGRIATFLLFVFFFFLCTSYSANIVALLSSTTTDLHGVRALKDLGVKLGADKAIFSQDTFQSEQSIDHVSLFNEKLVKDECYMSLNDGVELIRTDFFAFHGLSDQMYKMINRRFVDSEKCGFIEIPFLSQSKALIPLRKGSLHKERIKIGLGIFFERGIYSRLLRIMFADRPKCHSNRSHFVSVSLMDCYFAFVIYVSGLVLSCLIFILEILSVQIKIKKT